MDVEAIAVSQISRMIASCSVLKAYISTNDKTPFTDGYVDIYSSIRQSKADWRGRVPLQVKGRTRRSKKRSLPSYPIARTDLLAYQKDSGVLYFVVAVDPDTSRCAPYYSVLSPFAIESILTNAPEGRATVPVPLKKLPSDPNSIERIVALALKTRDQNVALGFDPVLFERAKSFTVHTTSELDFSTPITLSPGANDFALVLNTTDGLSIPLSGELHIFSPQIVKRPDLRIRSGAVTYEGAALRRLGDKDVEAELSDGLRLAFHLEPGSQSTDVSLTLERTLLGRLKALEFYIALLDSEVIEINGNPSPFEITRSDDDAWIREHLETLHALKDLFEHLGVDTRLIDLDEIDETQTRQLAVLYRAFVLKEEIAHTSAETSSVRQQVGRWHLMFLITPGTEPGKWQFTDPFSIDSRQQFMWSAEDKAGKDAVPVTAYDVVEQEHLGGLLNMRLDSIVAAYEAISDFPSTHGLADQEVLALIAAADATAERKEELLAGAARLNEWLIEEMPDEPHHLINRWQISSRLGALSVEQRSEIRKLRRTVAGSAIPRAAQIELACALLLEDGEEVEDLIQQLPEELLLQMQQWPIWELRKQ